MKFNFLNISKAKMAKVIVCALFLSAYQAKSAVDTSSESSYIKAVRCAENAGKHMKNLAKWNHDFIHSSKTYKQLLVQFRHCAKWFQENVEVPPTKRSIAIEEVDVLIKEMEVIVGQIKEMMIEMFKMLKGLENEKDAIMFLVKMQAKKDEMDGRLKDILAKIVVLEKNCKDKNLSDLYKEVANMQKTIIDFRAKNQGVEQIIQRRVCARGFLS